MILFQLHFIIFIYLFIFDSGFPLPDTKRADFPFLDIRIENAVFFFETKNPSVQKIDVIDNTKYNPSYTSRFSDPPTTKSF